MRIEILSVTNLGEALQVMGRVDGKQVSTTIKSPLMFEDKERGIFNLLMCRAQEIPVANKPSEEPGPEIDHGTIMPKPPDAARVTSVKAIEETFKKLKPAEKVLVTAEAVAIAEGAEVKTMGVKK